MDFFEPTDNLEQFYKYGLPRELNKEIIKESVISILNLNENERKARFYKYEKIKPEYHRKFSNICRYV
jgi:hypothetical protein